MGCTVVTGATGFIGRHLVPQLIDRGEEVVCSVRAKSQSDHLRGMGARLIPADMTDPASLVPLLDQADSVFHLAATTHALRREHFERTNRQGVENLLAACAARPNPPRVVLVSSLAAAGPAPEDRARVESDPPRPVSMYGQSKRQGEEVAERYAARVPLTIVRPPIVFGPGEIHFVALVKPIVQLGLHLVPGLVPKRFSLIHAEDCSAGLIAARDHGAVLSGNRNPSAGNGATNDQGNYDGRGYYFVADEAQPDFAELGTWIAQAADCKVRVLATPAIFTWMVGGVFELAGRLRGQPLSFSLDKAREALAGSWTCSSEQARRDLGFATRQALPARLRETIAWYRDQGWV